MKTDNEIIAEFMECSKPPNTDFDYFWRGNFFKSHNAKWNTSWDWLMPVVDAIEELEEPHPSNNPEKGTVWPYQFEILSRTTVQIVDNRNDNSIVLVSKDGLTKIESVYRAVVEFIKWYNQQTK